VKQIARIERAFGKGMLLEMLKRERHEVRKTVPLTDQQAQIGDAELLQWHASEAVSLRDRPGIDGRVPKVLSVQLLQALVANVPEVL
jgi:hypothetical protein